ncbi:hypothetical protein Syun_001120 [Stephania yunnanensis]|uniref:Uncharacterized protein n=1 Tax=Stephania yunnanensis TaxID=152371 RepID=A0AAP0LE59_9MAGN
MLTCFTVTQEWSGANLAPVQVGPVANSVPGMEPGAELAHAPINFLDRPWATPLGIQVLGGGPAPPGSLPEGAPAPASIGAPLSGSTWGAGVPPTSP